MFVVLLAGRAFLTYRSCNILLRLCFLKYKNSCITAILWSAQVIVSDTVAESLLCFVHLRSREMVTLCIGVLDGLSNHEGAHNLRLCTFLVEALIVLP